MPLPDVKCSIKVTQEPSGSSVPNGAEIGPGTVTVHYVVKTDSIRPVGPLTVVGSLYRDGVKVTPDGAPNVVPAQQTQVSKGNPFEKKYTLSEGGKGLVKYSARILADVGNFVNESDESNNKARVDFAFLHIT
jgi:hypothetical protein